jgi:SAM-dependent methyltransferase
MDEREKYEAIWEFDQYRQNSPGAEKVADFIVRCQAPPGSVVADLGCGTGRASRKLSSFGYQVMSYDIAHNAPDPEPPLENFVVCPLWDLPAVKWEYSFCVDVMEHLPTDKVELVLGAIAARVERMAYFVIPHSKDGCGPELIGRRLHLTVKPPDWWDEVMDEIFDEYDAVTQDGYTTYWCR